MLISKNPMVLLSWVNTKLRDEYSSLDELCDATDTSKEELDDILSSSGYVYDQAQNQYKQK